MVLWGRSDLNSLGFWLKNNRERCKTGWWKHLIYSGDDYQYFQKFKPPTIVPTLIYFHLLHFILSFVETGSVKKDIIIFQYKTGTKVDFLSTWNYVTQRKISIFWREYLFTKFILCLLLHTVSFTSSFTNSNVTCKLVSTNSTNTCIDF